ncbi:MAG: hypothetical protein JXB20_02120 [Bacilli bacterium]|nr:hypothetical protein [Bacilli bacterium]MBN2696168.1 hypothetical protein [Bacilli bacterium]
MRKFFDELKHFYAEFGFKKAFDSCLGGFVFSSLVFVPVYVILGEVLIVYMYRVNTLTILLITAALGHNVLLHHLTKKALYLKMPDAKSDIHKLTLVSMIVTNIIALAIGLIILFVMIPSWMV